MQAVDEVAIRERAYRIWEQEGRPEGRAREHWEQAARELDVSPQPAMPEDLPNDLERNPGIGVSPGTDSPEDVDALRGDSTVEGDVENDTDAVGAVPPKRRGRTNK